MSSRAAELGLAYEEEKELIKALVSRAFKALRRQGYIARMNFMCCGGCASAEIANRVDSMPQAKREKLRGGMFYDSQEADRFKGSAPFSQLHINHGPIAVTGFRTTVPAEQVGQDLVNALKAEQLNVEWNGSPDRSVIVTGLADSVLAAYRLGGLEAVPGWEDVQALDVQPLGRPMRRRMVTRKL